MAASCAIAPGCTDEPQKEQNRSIHPDSQGGTDVTVAQDSPEIAPVAQISDEMREPLIDLLGHNVCRVLKDRVFALAKKGGASRTGGTTPTIGAYWIRSCSAREIDSQHVSVSISGIGWKYVTRTRNTAGAEFELNENVKFQVDISGTGTVDLAYGQETHVVTGYFVPTEPLDVTFDVTADIDIVSDEIWSSIVGTAASLIGASPERQGRESIRKRGRRSFRARLDHGMTFILDLCTGERYTRFGTFSAGEVPESAAPAERMNFQTNSVGILYKKSLIMGGPYQTNKPLTAYIQIERGNPVVAEWYCRYNAERIAEAYVKNEPLPEPEPVDRRIVSHGGPTTMTVAPDLQCPVVLVLRPQTEDSEEIELLYRVYYEGDVLRPLVQCGDR